MLKILLESLLMECAEQGLNADKEINKKEIELYE